MRVEDLNFNAGNVPSNEEIEQFFSKLSDVYNKLESSSEYVLDPSKVNNMMDCAKQIKEMLSGQDVNVSMNVFTKESKMGRIKILGKGFVVFKRPDLFSDICRNNRGLDINALNDGNIEVIISFDTAERFRKE